MATASKERPCLVVLPENVAVCGNQAIYHKNAEVLGEGQIQTYFMEKAKELGIHLVVGSVPICDHQTKRLYTVSLVYNNQGRRIADYFKLHLFDAKVGKNKIDIVSLIFLPQVKMSVVLI